MTPCNMFYYLKNVLPKKVQRRAGPKYVEHVFLSIIASPAGGPKEDILAEVTYHPNEIFWDNSHKEEQQVEWYIKINKCAT